MPTFPKPERDRPGRRTVPGHSLVQEGAPHDDRGRRIESRISTTAGKGRAKCSCGALSEILDSARQRKQWHRDHKNQILGDQVLAEINEAGGFDEWREQQRRAAGR